jgi:hypothetical protein
MEGASCDALSLKEACAASREGMPCYDDTLVPWKKLFICTLDSSDNFAIVLIVGVLMFMLSVVCVWVGVGLLSKVWFLCLYPHNVVPQWRSNIKCVILIALVRVRFDLVTSLQCEPSRSIVSQLSSTWASL